MPGSKIGTGNVVGRVAASLQADLIAVTGDPERNLTSLAKPTVVVPHGKIVR